MTFDAETLALAKEVLSRCEAKKLKLVTAESCTGGLVCAALTEIPGASAVIDRSYVVYSDKAKMDILGVREISLASAGAVSETVVREMAAGALEKAGAGVAIAVTGIAGPGGGTMAKPVGLVHLSVAVLRGSFFHARFDYGDIGRNAIRMATVRDALHWTVRALG